MEDEFERILAFFSLSPKEKEERLHEIFEDSVDYFERFKHIMINGTPEEKQEAAKKMAIIKNRIEAETKAIREKTGLSEEDLMKQSMQRKYFSDSQWHTIEGAKKKLEKGVAEMRDVVEGKASRSQPSEGASGPRKRKTRKPKKWIQS